MPYFGTGHFSSDEKEIKIAVCKTWGDVDPEQDSSPGRCNCHRTLSCLGPNWLKIVPNDQLPMWDVMQGWLETIIRWWQYSDPEPQQTLSWHLTLLRPWPRAPPDTAWQLPGNTVSDWRTRGCHQSGCDVSMSPCLCGDSQLFFMFVFSLDGKFMRCRSFWSFDDFDYPLGTVCAGGPELKWPQMCIFIFVIYLHIGEGWGLLEDGQLTYLSLKQMEKVSFLNPKCPFLHLGKFANTRNSIRKDFSL